MYKEDQNEHISRMPDADSKRRVRVIREIRYLETKQVDDVLSLTNAASPIAESIAAAYEQAKKLSDMLHRNAQASEMRDELARKRINTFTLLALISLERERGASEPERAVAEIQRRTDPMDAVIYSVQSTLSDRYNVHLVWPALVQLARSEKPPTPLIGYDSSNGIQWESATVKHATKFMRKEALRKRLDRQKVAAEYRTITDANGRGRVKTRAIT